MLQDIYIFDIRIDIYWLLVFISCVLMAVINIIRCKNYGYKKIFGMLTAIYVNIFAILGAIILFNIEHFDEKISLGLSFYGTVFFLPVFMLFLSLFQRNDINTFYDFWSLTIPFELCLVRFGCYLTGCCLGIVSERGVHFPFDPEGVYRIPIQLYECVIDILVFIILIILEKKQIKKGFLYPIFMCLYGICRFILEFFRDTNKYFYGLSNGQMFSFLSVIISFIWIILLVNKYSKINN